MNDYSSLFTSGLMLLCDSARPRSRQPSPEPSPVDDPKHTPGLCSFLSLDMAESLRTFATASSSSSRTHSRKPSAERRSRPASSVASSSKLVLVSPRPKGPVSPTSPRRRSLPQPKPVPLAELPVIPTAANHARSRSDSAASQILPVFNVSGPSQSNSDLPSTCTRNGNSAARKGPLASSSLKLELSSAPTTPCSPFPTTPRSSRAISMFSPLTPPAVDAPWLTTEPASPCDAWVDVFASALSPTTAESLLGLHLPRTVPVDENMVPRLTPKRARRRERHSAPSRNASVAANSMRSSQGSVTTSYRRTQRSGALARLEGRGVPRSEWMSDDDEPTTKFKPGLSLIPSMDLSERSCGISPAVCKLAPLRMEDQNSSFIDLTDDAVSLVARRGRVSSSVA